MASFIDVYDRYLTDVQGCSYHTAAQALRDAARVFCERTRAWRMTLPAYVTLANVTDYEFDLSSEMEIVRVISAKLDGRDLAIIRPDDAHNRASYLVVHDPFRFSISPAPAAGQQLEIFAAVEPSDTASTIPDEIYRKHGQAIAEGAKHFLFSKHGQPFSSESGAMDAWTKFQMGIDTAIANQAGGYSSAPVRVKGHFM